jgi:hypothetical protein
VRDRWRRQNHSDCGLEFVECGRPPEHRRGLDPELVGASYLLFSYCPVLWKAAGISSSITFAKAGARSVITSTGERCAISDVVKNLRAEG